MSEEVLSHGGKRETYSEFVEKFKPKKTTDDCITPPAVYEAVADWVANEYGLDRADFVRPFWPGGDYETFDYPEGCVVVDNPPFSILAEIRDFYMSCGIKFFLFAPALTLCRSARVKGVCILPIGVPITYANGAKVPTSFITNMDDTYIMRCIPTLYGVVKAVEDEAKLANSMPTYVFPDNVITAAAAQQFTKYGVEYNVSKDDGVYAMSLDSMRKVKKHLFGGGLLLSEKAAAEKAAAEKAAAEKKNVFVWQLSDRERAIVAKLSNK